MINTNLDSDYPYCTLKNAYGHNSNVSYILMRYNISKCFLLNSFEMYLLLEFILFFPNFSNFSVVHLLVPKLYNSPRLFPPKLILLNATKKKLLTKNTKLLVDFKG